MNDDLAIAALTELTGWDAPAPSELIGAARSEAVGVRSRRRSRVRHRLVLAALVAIALVGASLTPPGRAATGWVARVAGIGESPTLPQVGSIPGTPVVIDSGELSDGTPYELVAKGTVFGDVGPASAADSILHPKVICFQVDWPAQQSKGQGGACVDREAAQRGNNPALETSEFNSPAGIGLADGHSEDNRPGIFFGIVDQPNITDVRVIERSQQNGSETQLPSKTVPITGELLERVGGGDPISVFVASLDESQVQAMNTDQAAIAAVAYNDQGEVVGRNQILAGRCARVIDSLVPPPGSSAPHAPRPVPADGRSIPDLIHQCENETWNAGQAP
jgi:hypothetical protein